MFFDNEHSFPFLGDTHGIFMKNKKEQYLMQ